MEWIQLEFTVSIPYRKVTHHRNYKERPSTFDRRHIAWQFGLKLTHQVTREHSISLVCIPDRFAAENSLTKLQAEHGPKLIKHRIYKDKTGPGSTYTLRYTIRETVEEAA